jgi:2-polyprenyl-3-methyl-5-hydroxy-6-metoxy-1,4-benzoquinol methylase
MDKSLLVRIFGFPATLIHGDTLVLDRWLWLRQRLPVTANGDSLIDIGCGTGAFSIGAAKRGYQALGLSWDERNQMEAKKRAQICGVNASFKACLSG